MLKKQLLTAGLEKNAIIRQLAEVLQIPIQEVPVSEAFTAADMSNIQINNWIVLDTIVDRAHDYFGMGCTLSKISDEYLDTFAEYH